MSSVTPSAVKVIEHVGYRCDGCGANPIVGIRYRCMTCKDFDLCETCQKITSISSIGEHKTDHVLTPITVPLIAPGRVTRVIMTRQGNTTSFRFVTDSETESESFVPPADDGSITETTKNPITNKK